MDVRPATLDDLPAITELQRSWDIAWFGAPEQSEDETREVLGYADPLSDNSLLVFDGGTLLATALRYGFDSTLVVRPGADDEPIFATVLPWFAAGGGYVEAHNRDERLLGALARAGWTYRKSSFELMRAVTPDFVLAEPTWPPGVAVRGLGDDDHAALHHLVYVDAAWAEVPGHPQRAYDEWRSIFVNERTVPEQQVIVRRGERIIGAAIGRIWDDGTGWISQLATAKDERGKGLGRAMLLEAMRRQLAAGATSLGLSAQAANEHAIQLYLSVGLELDREWRSFAQPAG